MYQQDFREKPARDRASIAAQAKDLLKGNATWKPNVEQDEWEDVGEPVEVEQNVELPKLER